MALVASLIVYLLIVSAGECVETKKCEKQHNNRYICPNFDLSSLPEEEKVSVTIHTENLQRLEEISPKSNVFELVIESSINGVEPNSLKSLAGLNVLILQKNVIPIIETNSFGYLKLTSLVLQDDQITEIKPGAFRNSRFDLLRISDNELKEIKRDVFNNLDLKQLDLFNNKISSIEDGALADLPNLYTLKLENNALASFEAKKLFGGLPNLQILHLQHNSLATLHGSMFEGLQNLTTLLLGSNQISNVEPGTFHLPNLRKLDLGNNKIKKLNSNILSGDGLKSLWELYIHNNELTSLSTSFLSQFPNLRKISLAGNPWQCACLDLILNWIQESLPGGFQEARPACVDSTKESTTCNENYALSETELENFKKQHVKNFEVYN